MAILCRSLLELAHGFHPKISTLNILCGPKPIRSVLLLLGCLTNLQEVCKDTVEFLSRYGTAFTRLIDTTLDGADA